MNIRMEEIGLFGSKCHIITVWQKDPTDVLKITKDLQKITIEGYVQLSLDEFRMVMGLIHENN